MICGAVLIPRRAAPLKNPGDPVTGYGTVRWGTVPLNVETHMTQIQQPTPYEWARDLLAHRSAPRGRRCKTCRKEWPCADYSVAHEVLRKQAP